MNAFKLLMVSLLASNLAISDVYEVDPKIKERADKILKESESNRELHSEKIDKIEAYINSESYLARTEELSQGLALSLGLQDKKERDKKHNILPTGHKPILFVSSSMPLKVLKQYAQDLNKVNGVMILKGSVGGLSKLIPTIKLINKIKKDIDPLKLVINIDPKRFEANNIDRVPALIYEKNYENKPYCETEKIKDNNNIVFGDSSLEGMLLALYSINDDKDLLKPIDILQGMQ